MIIIILILIRISIIWLLVIIMGRVIVRIRILRIFEKNIVVV
jgi:hypothetical protein